MKVAVLPGDGIGPEIIAQAPARPRSSLELKIRVRGGAGRRRCATPPTAIRCREKTLALAKQADAVLFGAVGDPKYDNLPRAKRPEQAILGLRKELGAVRQPAPAQSSIRSSPAASSLQARGGRRASTS